MAVFLFLVCRAVINPIGYGNGPVQWTWIIRLIIKLRSIAPLEATVRCESMPRSVGVAFCDNMPGGW